MAIRTDIFSIDWSLSPRIINIDIAFTEASAQDLYDTCKFLEQQSDAIDEDQICDAGGKEPIGGGVTVGITVSLFNAKYKFADRPGPDWVICNMTGGNVAGFTDKTRTTELYPREPSDYVSADRTASSSATTQQQEALEFSSFNGGITVDEQNETGNAVVGTDFPAGTERAPCLLQEDANFLLQDKGFNKIYVKGGLNLDNGSLPWVGNIFIGQSQIKSLITVDAVADVFNCEFRDCTITGTLDGSSKLQQCLLTDLDFIDGYIFQCSLGLAYVKLGTSVQSDFFNCFSSVAGSATPVIDMNGTGTLALRNYSGGVLLKNYTGAGEHTIEMAQGKAILDSVTVTGGTFFFRGIGELVDENGNRIETGTWNGGVTVQNDLIDKYTLDRILAILEGDVVPTPSDFQILHRITKSVLVQKTPAVVDDLTQLTE